MLLRPLLTLLVVGSASACDRPRPTTPTLPPAAPVVTTTATAVVSEPVAPVAAAPPPATLTETFDDGRKGAYASAEETLPSGSWLLEETLIGAADQDRKTGRAALRMKPDGRARMQFDVRGAVRVTVRCATYGDDDAAPWQLQMTANQGRSWLSIGETQQARPGRLREVSFTVTPIGPARFALRHAGTASRINFDDFRIELNTTGADAVVVPAASAPVPPASTTPSPAPSPAATAAIANRLGVNHLAMGNPSGASATDPTNLLLHRPEYSFAYNRATNTANWVSWHLNRRWKGTARRTPGFSPDEALPPGFYRVTSGDYSGSGFDRGHLCPSDDRDYSPTENAATFRMTNIIPQAPANNQGPWRELEEDCRELAEGGSELYIVAGPAGQGGAGLNGPATTIGRGAQKIVVPKWTWKVIAVVPRGAATAAVPVPTRIIAVLMPNDQTTEHHHWPEYRVSVRKIEELTGYDFFSSLPKAVQQALETKADAVPVR